MLTVIYHSETTTVFKREEKINGIINNDNTADRKLLANIWSENVLLRIRHIQHCEKVKVN